MRIRTYGAISTALMITVFSGMLNLLQGVYNFKYFKADKNTQALNTLVRFERENEDQFQKDFDAAMTVMKTQVQRLYPPDAEALEASIQRLASERDSMVSHVKAQEKVYRDNFNKSYPPADLSWAKDYALDTRLKVELRERYIEIRKKGETGKLEKLFSFAGAVDPTWVTVRTRQSVNVRLSPRSNAQIVAAIPENSVCSIVSVNSDQSWLEIQGEAPNAFLGWVYVQFLEPSNSYFLN